MLCCGAVCGGGAKEGTMQLTCLSLVHFPSDSHVRLGVSPNHLIPSTPSLSFSLCQPRPCGPLTRWGFSQPALPVGSTSLPWFLSIRHLISLVVLFNCFFNSMVVGVPCGLIFCHFWLFIDFRLVVILLLVVQRVSTYPPSWPELSREFFIK